MRWVRGKATEWSIILRLPDFLDFINARDRVALAMEALVLCATWLNIEGGRSESRVAHVLSSHMISPAVIALVE
jgi:hypothetical protein